MRGWTVTFVAGLALAGLAVEAHHSIASVYDSAKRVTVEGVISRFEFVNPHPLMTIEVRDGQGPAVAWRLEMDNRSELAAIGITSQTLKPGDLIVVSGSPARSDANRLYVLRLDRPADGFGFEQVGSSPRIRTVSR